MNTITIKFPFFPVEVISGDIGTVSCVKEETFPFVPVEVISGGRDVVGESALGCSFPFVPVEVISGDKSDESAKAPEGTAFPFVPVEVISGDSTTGMCESGRWRFPFVPVEVVSGDPVATGPAWAASRAREAHVSVVDCLTGRAMRHTMTSSQVSGAVWGARQSVFAFRAVPPLWWGSHMIQKGSSMPGTTWPWPQRASRQLPHCAKELNHVGSGIKKRSSASRRPF
jgi:hypothetical protein